MDQTLATDYRHRTSEYDEVYENPERQDDIAGLGTIICADADSRRIREIAGATGFSTAPAAENAASICATDLVDGPLAVARIPAWWNSRSAVSSALMRYEEPSTRTSPASDSRSAPAPTWTMRRSFRLTTRTWESRPFRTAE
jgi:hypothetical protein